MQEKLIELEGKETRILIQWGEGKAVISSTHRVTALDADGLDSLIAALLRARGQMQKRERATLYARVPHDLKSEFLAKAQKKGLTQNAAIIAAVRRFLDPAGRWRGR